LKTFGALRKQSKRGDQENSLSPVKVFGSSPLKKSSKKTLLKASTTDEKMLSGYASVTLKASPLKKQMRTFENISTSTSPCKHVSELGKTGPVPSAFVK